MSAAQENMIRKRLEWIDPAREGILKACGDDVINETFTVFPTVDPLRFILKISLRLPIGKKTREPLRAYLRCWAEDHGCDLPVIRINDRYVQAEVLTRSRTWNRDSLGRFKPGNRRFEKKAPPLEQD
jgi:hypothetical protein